MKKYVSSAFGALRLVALVALLLLLVGCTGAATPAQPAATQEAAPEKMEEVKTEEALMPTQEVQAQPMPREATAAEASVLNTAYFEDINTLDPDVWYDIEGGGLFRAVYDTLVRYKPGTQEIEPWLAKSWEVSDDGLTYTFKLHEGVKFHDGTPFNAEAVKFNFERRLAVNQGPAYMLADIQNTEVVDDYTIRLTLKEQTAPFLHLLANMWGSKMISPTAIKDHEKEGDWAQDWLISNAVGTGPYKLERYDRGQQYVLVKNEDYWAGWDQPHVDKIVIRIVAEPTTQRLMLENGDLDILMHGVPFADLNAFRQNADLVVEERSSNFIHRLVLNTQKEPLTDPKLRKALAWAWDYEGIIQTIGEGTYLLPWKSAYPPGFLGGEKPEVPYRLDMEQAKALMAESQHAEGGFTLEFFYLPNEREYWREAAQVYQANLAQLNINLDIQEIPVSVYWELREAPDTTPHLFADSATPDGSDPHLWASIAWDSEGWLNHSWYRNDEVDRLIDEGLHTTDVAKRAEVYQKIGEIVIEEVPMLFVAAGQDHFAYRKNLGGIVQYPAFPWTIDFYYVHKQ